MRRVKTIKRMMTLLEVLIALGLTVILLTALSFFYRELTRYDKAGETLRREEINLRHVDIRLQKSLAKSLSYGTLGTDFLFFTGSGGEGLFWPGTSYLLFAYDRGIDRDPLFSNEVIGRLFVDSEKNLTLATWPIFSRWETRQSIPIKKEILLSNVTGLKFSFFYPTEKTSSKPKPKSEVPKVLRATVVQEPKCGDEWRNEWARLPAIVTVILTRGTDEKSEEKIVIPLVNFDKWIIYGK